MIRALLQLIFQIRRSSVKTKIILGVSVLFALILLSSVQEDQKMGLNQAESNGHVITELFSHDGCKGYEVKRRSGVKILHYVKCNQGSVATTYLDKNGQEQVIKN